MYGQAAEPGESYSQAHCDLLDINALEKIAYFWLPGPAVASNKLRGSSLYLGGDAAWHGDGGLEMCLTQERNLFRRARYFLRIHGGLRKCPESSEF